MTFHYGFEVVPDLRHLQLHILSTDFAYVTDPCVPQCLLPRVPVDLVVRAVLGCGVGASP